MLNYISYIRKLLSLVLSKQSSLSNFVLILCSFLGLPAVHFKREGVGPGRICTAQEGNTIRVGLSLTSQGFLIPP